MIQVVIGEDKRDLRDIDPAWLRALIEHQRDAGVPVCVQVVMNFAQVNMILATSGCPAGGSPKPDLGLESGYGFGGFVGGPGRENQERFFSAERAAQLLWPRFTQSLSTD